MAVTVKRTQSSSAKRSPPESVCTTTRLATTESTCQPTPAFEPVTDAALTVKFAGTSTHRQPISALDRVSASGSVFVAVRVKVRLTPVVAASGDAVIVHSALSAAIGPAAAN